MLAIATTMTGSISFRSDETLRSFVDSPFHAGKRSGSVENVLSVVQIQNGITVSRKSAIAGRQVHPEHRAGSREFSTETSRCNLMFPVSVCLRIESKRFVEKQT